MTIVWTLFGIMCSGHTNASCWPIVVALPSREACEEALLTRPRAVCLPLAGQVVTGQKLSQ